MALTTEELTASFATLKKNARCDSDILTWLQQHPESIPDVPDYLRPYLQISMRHTSNYNEYATKSETTTTVQLGRALSVEYAAKAPKEVMADVYCMNSFRAITQVEITCSNSHSSLREIQTSFWMTLSAQEWPYVAVMHMLDIVQIERDTKSDEYMQMLDTNWAQLFPTTPLNTVMTLVRSGIAPNDAASLTGWLATQCQNEGASVLCTTDSLPVLIEP